MVAYSKYLHLSPIPTNSTTQWKWLKLSSGFLSASKSSQWLFYNFFSQSLGKMWKVTLCSITLRDQQWQKTRTNRIKQDKGGIYRLLVLSDRNIEMLQNREKRQILTFEKLQPQIVWWSWEIKDRILSKLFWDCKLMKPHTLTPKFHKVFFWG